MPQLRRQKNTALPVALTIAGSDSGGGAGIQADLKTFAALKVFGTSAITCLTAQNPDAVTGVEVVTPAMVQRQIDAVCDGFPVDAAKTGMLYSSAIMKAVAESVRRRGIRSLVVDPVMIATSGACLLKPDALRRLRAEILPLAMVITPNLPEAEALTGLTLASIDDLQAAAQLISKRYGTACVVKGGHLAGARVTNVLYCRGTFHLFTAPRIAARETHGTGCTFSAALTAGLALGQTLPMAVGTATRFVHTVLRTARRAGRHYPLNIQPGRS